MVTNYSGYSQEHIYKLAKSGNPDSLSAAAGHLKTASEALTKLNDALSSKVSQLSTSWTGDAADEYMNQSSSIVSSSQQLAANTQTTSSLIDSASKLLKSAHDTVPKPPSTWDKIKHGAEDVMTAPGQAVSKLTGSSVAGYIADGVTGGGTGVLAAMDLQQQQNDANKSVEVMTNLANGYAQIEKQLATSTGSYDSTNQKLNGGSTTSSANVGAPGGYSPGGYAGSAGGGAAGVGAGGAGAYPGGGGVAGGSLNAPGLGAGGSAGSAGGAGSGSLGGLGGVGAGAGGSSVAGAGLGAGALAGLGAGGAAGLGGGAAAGVSASGLGKLGGLGALAKNSGLATGLGKSSMGAEGEGAEGAATAEGEGAGGMMGAGGMGQTGGQEKRGQRAGYLTQDPEYWTGNKQVNPAVIDH